MALNVVLEVRTTRVKRIRAATTSNDVGTITTTNPLSQVSRPVKAERLIEMPGEHNAWFMLPPDWRDDSTMPAVSSIYGLCAFSKCSMHSMRVGTNFQNIITLYIVPLGYS